MRCPWFKGHALGFDTTKKEYNCKERSVPNSSCFYIYWPTNISLSSEYERDEFLIFLWEQEMGIK